ncbi:MAG: glycosyl hydrolase family 28 protein [Rikenellaceae bacterium]|nr:glycosyl hydrolase family 28 protein [Rikenellaceae bacterium]
MRKSLHILLFHILCFSFISCQSTISESIKHFGWEKNVGAQIFPDNDRVYFADEYGAVGDGETLNTSILQRLIDQCAENGGGTVELRSGTYLTGSIYLKSGVNLYLNENAILKASEDINDYPFIVTRVEGIELPWPSAVINIIDQNNASVSGKGSLDGSGNAFRNYYVELREEYRKKSLDHIIEYEIVRPKEILIQNSLNVTLKNITIINSGLTSVHILYSQFITADSLVLYDNDISSVPLSNGIIIDSSTDVLVENTIVSNTINGFYLQAGRGNDGLRINRATERVIIRNSTAEDSHSLLTLGNTSGGINDIVIYNLTGQRTGSGIRITSDLGQGGTIENIYIDEVVLNKVENPLVFRIDTLTTVNFPEIYDIDSISPAWRTLSERVSDEKGIPDFLNINIASVNANDAGTAIIAVGSDRKKLTDFHFTDVHITCIRPGTIKNAENWTMENFTAATSSGEKIDFENVENISVSK